MLQISASVGGLPINKIESFAASGSRRLSREYGQTFRIPGNEATVPIVKSGIFLGDLFWGRETHLFGHAAREMMISSRG